MQECARMKLKITIKEMNLVREQISFSLSYKKKDPETRDQYILKLNTEKHYGEPLVKFTFLSCCGSKHMKSQWNKGGEKLMKFGFANISI